MRQRHSLLSLNLLTLAALLATFATLLITGCGVGRLAPPSSQPGIALRGGVHGGQQPVSGANVYLLAANTTGYAGAGIAPSGANASLSLLNAEDTGNADQIGAFVVTDANGNFNITGDYTCIPNSQVYVYAHGGNPGAGTNSAAGFLALLGNCPAAGNFSSVPFIEVNEVSTVAAAYAFAGFASDPLHVSTNGSPQALTGLANAFATASNLVDLGSGTALALTPAGNGTAPQATLNTLANILASCINSADLTASGGGLPYSPACIALGLAVAGGNLNSFYGYTYDTSTAAIFIAQAPAANTASLYALSLPQAPFSPALTTQPNDFTLSIVFTGGPFNFGGQLAVDAQGNVWIPYEVNNGADGSIEKFSNLGVLVSGAWTQTNLIHPVSVAIDTSQNAWIANLGTGGVLTEFSSSGVELGTTADPTNPSYNLLSPTFDLSGNLWTTDGSSPGNLLKFSSTGTFLQTITGNGLDSPGTLAFDTNDYLWVDNQLSNTMGAFVNGVPAFGNPFSLMDTSPPEAISADAVGNHWVLKQDAAIDVLDGSGSEIKGSPYNTGFGGSTNPHALFQAIDGAGNDWITTTAYNFSSFPPVIDYNLIALSSSGTLRTPAPGIAINVSFPPGGVALDSSGNLWLSSNNQLLEYVGLSTPIETPLIQALSDTCLAQRPCLPPS